MLAYILAIVVGLSSLYLLTTAFIAPDRHRQDDFLWGAVGLFYALILWLCAVRITGAILLGQVAAATLFIAFAWQTLKLRQTLFYPDKPAKLFTIVGWLGNRLGKVTPSPSPKTKLKAEKGKQVAEKAKEIVKETVKNTTETAAQKAETVQETVTPVAEKIVEKVASVTEEPSEKVLDDSSDIFDDFDDDFELESEVTASPIVDETINSIQETQESSTVSGANIFETPLESPIIETIETPEIETIAVSETVIIEVPVEDLPQVEAILEDATTETRSQTEETSNSSD
jgi:hypothetical protein